MQQHELMERIQDALAELATIHAEAAAIAERAWTALAENDGDELQGGACDECQNRSSSSGRPLISSAKFTAQWHGRCCDLGPSIMFKLIQRLARRPNRYYSYDVLMADVWDRRCSNETVRSAVKRLRKALRKVGTVFFVIKLIFFR